MWCCAPPAECSCSAIGGTCSSNVFLWDGARRRATCPTSRGMSETTSTVRALLSGIRSGRGHVELWALLTPLNVDEVADRMWVRVLSCVEFVGPVRLLRALPPWYRMMLRMVLSSNVDAMVRELGVEDPRALVWRLTELSILCEREVMRARVRAA